MGWVKNIGRAVTKGVKDTGHAVGDAANNKYVKAATAAALMASGVGAPMGAAVMAGMGTTGGALKRGGGARDAIRGGYQGAAQGALAGAAPAAVGRVASLARGGGSVASLAKTSALSAAQRVLSGGKPGPMMGSDDPGTGGWDETIPKVGTTPSTSGGLRLPNIPIPGLPTGGAPSGGNPGVMSQILDMVKQGIGFDPASKGGQFNVGNAARNAAIAGLSAKALYDSHTAGQHKEELRKRALALTDENVSQAHDLMAGARPIRQASEGELLKRITAGPEATPDLTGIRDRANPFTRNFTPPVDPHAANAMPRPAVPPPMAPPNLAPPTDPSALPLRLNARKPAMPLRLNARMPAMR